VQSGPKTVALFIYISFININLKRLLFQNLKQDKTLKQILGVGYNYVLSA
jgi:hypothetical protein